MQNLTGQNFVAGDTFRWLLNGAPIGGETNSTYNAAAGGFLMVLSYF